MFRVNWKPSGERSYVHDSSWERRSLQDAMELLDTLAIIYRPGQWEVRDIKGVRVAKVNTTAPTTPVHR